MFKTLRQENESIIKLKGVTPGHRLPMGTLLAGKDTINNELDRFDHARNIDAMNERIPETAPSKDKNANNKDGEKAAAAEKARRRPASWSPPPARAAQREGRR